MTVPDVRITRLLAAPPEKVYAAWTDPGVLERWFCPNPDLPLTVTADVVVGGRYRVQMGSAYTAEGAYTELTPPSVVAFTWCWTSAPDEVSQVRVELAPTPDGGTELVLVHRDLADVDDAAGHAEGWELSLARLVGLG